MIEDFGSNSNPSCDGTTYDTHGNPLPAVANTYGTGWDLCYSAINRVLWDNPPTACGDRLCDMLDLINSAPYSGPFSHSSASGSEYLIPDFASCGWASGRRFMFAQDPDFNGQAGQEGNNNGLDYMVFFNLYYLLSEQQNPTVTLHPVYPYNGNLGYTGFYNIPSTVRSSCANIGIEQLDITNSGSSPDRIAGGLAVLGGTKNNINIYPQTGEYVHVENGGFFHAVCPLTCSQLPDCDVSNSYYSYQLDPDPINTNGSDARYTPPYQKTPEFDTTYNANAFSNYPNPFMGLTTIDFTLSSSGPISIYVSNSTGAIITKLVDNQTYSSGGHIINYVGADLAAGIYYCTLIANGNKKTIKMIHTK
jgi:hypothetical protein